MSAKTLLALLLAAGLAFAAAAQEEDSQLTEPAEEPLVDPLTALTVPGEHHEHLGRLAGDWDLKILVWQEPEGEPLESAGTAESRWILDGRFLWTIYRARLFGQPFEAWSIEGYDNQAQQYVGTWRDTQGTYTLIYRGDCKHPPPVDGEPVDEAEEAPAGTYREMKTQLTDPVSQEKLDIRVEMRIEEDGSGFVQQSFIELSPEESLKNLEIVGTRRADG